MTDGGFVFTTRRGEPLSPYTLTKYWHGRLDEKAAALAAGALPSPVAVIAAPDEPVETS